MFYYDVATGGLSRGSRGVFTYSSDKSLPIGQCVVVQIQQKNAFGFIVKKSSRPDFQTSEIISILEEVLPAQSVIVFQQLQQLYPLSDQALANLFLPPKTAKRRTIDDIPVTAQSLLPLSRAQQRLVNDIKSTPSNVLLHGDTATGKTRIYSHLAKDILESGRSVILLVPEIGLATFTYQELSAFFPDAILYHSKTSPAQRSKLWHRVQSSTTPLFLIGPRSVLSLPVKDIGLILIDEAHDQSYRQENAPFVNAKVIASLFAKEHNSQVIYGTATPLITDYTHAQSVGMPIVRLTEQAVQTDAKVTTHIASYEDTFERSKGTLLRSSINSISQALSSNGQSLVLINRRGTARYVACDNCGHESRCERCDRLLTYHHDSYQLRCHHCDKKYPVPALCTKCGESAIHMRSVGSKAVVDELIRLFPDAVIKRFDTDNDKNDHLLSHIEDIKSGKIQIIVGTQMIAKGLDLPKLKSLVVFAGGSSSGYMSEEREFELLYQVLGRAMRGHQDTSIVIQTSNPESAVLKWVIERDYDSFLHSELVDRKTFHYPPFCYMMLIHIRRKTSKGAAAAGEKLVMTLQKNHPGLRVGSPTPNTVERLGPFYNWHVIVKSNKRSILTGISEQIGTNFQCELDPVDIP